MLPKRDCIPCGPRYPGALNGVPQVLLFRPFDQRKINVLTSHRSGEGQSDRELQRVPQTIVFVTCPRS